MPWTAIRSVDVDPGLTPGSRSRPAILVYTAVSPRIAIRFVPQSRFGVLRPSIDAMGAVVARLRELQGTPSA